MSPARTRYKTGRQKPIGQKLELGKTVQKQLKAGRARARAQEGHGQQTGARGREQESRTGAQKPGARTVHFGLGTLS